MKPEFVQTLLQPQWFVPLFALLWLTISGMLAGVGGWAGLASVYPARNEAVGERFRFASGSMGGRFLPVGYRNCLFVTVNENGIRLSMFFLFRFLSPPIFIPWSRVKSMEEKRVLFVNHHTMLVRDHWARISLGGAAGQRVKEQFDAYQAGGAGRLAQAR